MKRADNKNLCRRIGFDFKDEELLKIALTHSSYCYEHKLSYNQNNERLEFLGDAVLDAVIAEKLYTTLSETEEGELSKLRASVVCEDSLFRKAREINLPDYMLLGRGEELHAGSGKHRALIADALEAVFGAVYLDSGWADVRRVILSLFEDIIKDALSGRLKNDYKSALQEILQASGEYSIDYIILGEEGPDHDKTFYAAVKNMGRTMGKGSGKTKKQAEQQAAKDALENRGLV